MAAKMPTFTPADSVLLLIDHQTGTMQLIKNIPPPGRRPIARHPLQRSVAEDRLIVERPCMNIIRANERQALRAMDGGISSSSSSSSYSSSSSSSSSSIVPRIDENQDAALPGYSMEV